MKRPMTLVWALAAVTFLFQLVFGVYYATRSEHLESRPTLALQGDAFLRVFPGWNEENEGDAAAYNRAAMETMRTGIPRTRGGAVFFHAPVYAYFLAACYALGGVRLISVAIPQAALAGFTCLLIGLAAFRAAPQRKELAAVLASCLVLINLRLAMYVGYISPTALVGCLTAVAMEAVTGSLRNGRLVRFCVAVILGCFTQAVFFVVGLAAGLWLLWQYLRHRQLAFLVAASVLAMAGLAKPAVTFLGLGGGTNDPLARGARNTLWEANNPYYESMRWTSLWERRPGNPWTKWTVSEAEKLRHEEYLERAATLGMHPGVLWIRENPAQYVKLCRVRLTAALGPFTGQMSPRNRTISTVWWLLVVPAGAMGLWWMRRENAVSFVVLSVALLTVFSALVIVEWYQRYRMPVDLMMTVYASLGYLHIVYRKPAGN